MRLLFVLSSLHRGGAERHTLDLAAALAARGHDSRVLTVKGPVAGGLQVSAEAGIGHASLDGRRYLDREALGRLRADVLAYGPDVVVCASSYALLYAWWALGGLRRRGGPRLASVFHTTRLRTAKDEVLGWMYRRVYARADLLVYVCEAQRQYWTPRGLRARRVGVVHNGVDTAHFRPDPTGWRARTRAALGLDDDDCVLGITAAFRPEKNHGFLVRALASLRADGLPVVLLMVGDGALRSATEILARELGVERWCRFVGAHDDVRPWVAAFDVFVLASTHIETFPLSALEAMAMGVPAVLSDVGGAREMVIDGTNGYLYPPEDAQRFGSAVKRLLDPQARTAAGQAARRLVVERYTHDRMVQAYEELLGA